MALTIIAIVRLVDIPQTTNVTMVLSNPRMIMGFLPYRSAARPQGTAVMLWASEKTALVRPAQRAILFCSTPKSLIISGRYGKTEV